MHATKDFRFRVHSSHILIMHVSRLLTCTFVAQHRSYSAFEYTGYCQRSKSIRRLRDVHIYLQRLLTSHSAHLLSSTPSACGALGSLTGLWRSGWEAPHPLAAGQQTSLPLPLLLIRVRLPVLKVSTPCFLARFLASLPLGLEPRFAAIA